MIVSRMAKGEQPKKEPKPKRVTKGNTKNILGGKEEKNPLYAMPNTTAPTEYTESPLYAGPEQTRAKNSPAGKNVNNPGVATLETPIEAVNHENIVNTKDMADDASEKPADIINHENVTLEVNTKDPNKTEVVGPRNVGDGDQPKPGEEEAATQDNDKPSEDIERTNNNANAAVVASDTLPATPVAINIGVQSTPAPIYAPASLPQRSIVPLNFLINTIVPYEFLDNNTSKTNTSKTEESIATATDTDIMGESSAVPATQSTSTSSTNATDPKVEATVWSDKLDRQKFKPTVVTMKGNSTCDTCPTCPNLQMTLESKLQIKFDDKILQKACQRIYEYSDQMEFFWKNRFLRNVDSINSQLAEEIQDIKETLKRKAAQGTDVVQTGGAGAQHQSIYSERVQRQVIEIGQRINKKYLRAGLELYQYSFDLMTKELPNKMAYLNYWKSRPNFQDIEDKLEDKKAKDLIVIQERIASQARRRQQKVGGHFGEFVEGQAWGGTVAHDMGTQSEAVNKQDEGTQYERPHTRTIDVVIGEVTGPDDVFYRSRTHTFGEFDALLSMQKELAMRRMNDLIKQYEETFSILQRDGTGYLLEENRNVLEAEKIKMNDRFVKLINKLSAIYNSEYSLMDIIFDSQFMVIYVLKLITYGFFALSLFLAEKLFSDMYMKNVYGNGGSPPDILIFIGITLALNLAFVIFLLVVMLLIMYIFKSPTNNFIIDMNLIGKFMMDYAISTVIIGLVGVICGSIIQKKRYFRYATEGLRGVRALYELMLSLGALVVVVPYFYLV